MINDLATAGRSFMSFLLWLSDDPAEGGPPIATVCDHALGRLFPVAKTRIRGVCMTPAKSPSRAAGHVALIILATALLFVIFVRWRLREMPLERDEGGFAYLGQLLLQGIPPFQLAWDIKPPGLYLAYSAMMAMFGQSAAGIHLGLLAVNLATIGLVFLLTRDLFDPLTGSLAAAAYALLALSPSVLGVVAHATHFTAFFGVAATWVLWRALQSDRTILLLLSGILFGRLSHDTAERVLALLRHLGRVHALCPPASVRVAEVDGPISGCCARHDPALRHDLPLAVARGALRKVLVLDRRLSAATRAAGSSFDRGIPVLFESPGHYGPALAAGDRCLAGRSARLSGRGCREGPRLSLCVRRVLFL